MAAHRNHPYRALPDRSFWKRAVSSKFDPAELIADQVLLHRGDRVASAGSCFAAHIVPWLEQAGFRYVRTESYPALFGPLADDNFSYSKFSAAYGNIYTVRQAVQLLHRVLGRFKPLEDRWIMKPDLVIDPFRPGLKYPAASESEFEALSRQHLEKVGEAFQGADCFIFTLGLTEAWISSLDGAVFPACPGTVGGEFDASRHIFHNFSVAEVTADLDALIESARQINPKLRFILTVSPVPLVATATPDHVLLATIYSKSVLRVAAGEAARRHQDVTYFPAYEIVTGPQAPEDFFEVDRREPSAKAIARVMGAFLVHCDTNPQVDPDEAQRSAGPTGTSAPPSRQSAAHEVAAPSPAQDVQALAAFVAEALCEEAAVESFDPEASAPPWTTVDFAREGNSATYRGRGWSVQEEMHVWATGEYSEVVIDHIPERGGLHATLELWPMVKLPELSAQRLVIVANGETVADFSLTGKTTLEFSIPEEMLRKQDVLLLEFKHPDAVRPCDLLSDPTADSRLLSLAFQRLTLYDAPSRLPPLAALQHLPAQA